MQWMSYYYSQQLAHSFYVTVQKYKVVEKTIRYTKVFKGNLQKIQHEYPNHGGTLHTYSKRYFRHYSLLDIQEYNPLGESCHVSYMHLLAIRATKETCHKADTEIISATLYFMSMIRFPCVPRQRKQTKLTPQEPLITSFYERKCIHEIEFWKCIQRGTYLEVQAFSIAENFSKFILFYYLFLAQISF